MLSVKKGSRNGRRNAHSRRLDNSCPIPLLPVRARERQSPGTLRSGMDAVHEPSPPALTELAPVQDALIDRDIQELLLVRRHVIMTARRVVSAGKSAPKCSILPVSGVPNLFKMLNVKVKSRTRLNPQRRSGDRRRNRSSRTGDGVGANAAAGRSYKTTAPGCPSPSREQLACASRHTDARRRAVRRSARIDARAGRGDGVPRAEAPASCTPHCASQLPPGGSQARRRERDEERRNGRRVLNENHVRFSHDVQEMPE